MNNDLISRKVLKDALIELFQEIDNMYIAGRVISLVNLQPTAHDIDKVVEQLEVYRASSRDAYEDAIVSSNMRLGIATRNQEAAFIKAIEIVKGGGRHDD